MIPFNIPYYSGNEKNYMAKAMDTKTLTGDLAVIRMCEKFLENNYNFKKVFLTNSCTIALEMAAVLAEVGIGDEVIMPSYTYVSTANAFVLRGAKIIFVDSKIDHPNMDENEIEKLITNRTKAIVVVHYGGVACNLNVVKAITKKHNLILIEDAAQCINSFYNKEALGTIGDIACFSFHETKNIHCGEGGFISINNSSLINRAEIIRNKGTNRAAFSQGKVNKYEWMDIGFSSIPSAITAAFLFSQMEQIDNVQKKRMQLWNSYFYNLKALQQSEKIQLPIIPDYASNNGHLFYLICKTEKERNQLIHFLKSTEIQAVFHYQSLHNSPFYSSKHGGRFLPNAEKYSSCLVRLPLYYDLTIKDVDYICDSVIKFYKEK